jgi:hypothetical protein
MKHLTWWGLFLCLMLALEVKAKTELSLPSITIGKSTYSNVVLTASGTNRISVEHPLGLATIKTANLELEIAQRLLDAGVITEGALKGNTNYQAWLKEQKLSEKQRKRAANPPGVLAQHAGMEGSMGERWAEQLELEVNARGGFDPERLMASLGMPVVAAVLCGVVFFYFLHCWCLFRIVKKSTGQGSLLVLLPGLRWFSLIRAAGMSRHFLLFPFIALGLVFCQPSMPDKFPWAETAYHYLTVGVCGITALLYVVWGFKISRRAGGSPLLGLFLIVPLLKILPLLYLASGGEGSAKSATASKGKTGSNRPVFAV